MVTIELSEWDTNHFGFNVAKIEMTPQEQIEEIIDSCRKQGIELLICKCNTSYTSSVRRLEKAGFELMGTLVSYTAGLSNISNTLPTNQGIILRLLKEEDISLIADMTFKSFKNYIDHFHVDYRLDTSKCDDLYRQWGRNSCSDKNLADEVVVAESGKSKVVGFVTIKLTQAKTSDLVLACVDPDFRGRGLYRSLISAGIEWSRSKGLSKVESTTQINNYAVQHIWSSLGLRMDDSTYVFHKWFNEVNK